MTADPVRPQETLRNALAVALRNAVVQVHISKETACILADAVLPIVEEETAEIEKLRLECAVEERRNASDLAALRDKVKALADEADKNLAEWREAEREYGSFGEVSIGLGLSGFFAENLRALVEEPQPRSGRDVYFDNLRKTAGPRVLAIIDKMQAVEEPQGGEQ